MATAELETEVPPPADSPPVDEGGPMPLDETVKHWAAVRLGHEAVMLDSVQRAVKYKHNAARAAYEHARTGQLPEITAAEDEMGVSIGNTITYHVTQSGNTEKQATTTATETKPVVLEAPKMPTWLKAAVGAWMVGGPVGALLTGLVLGGDSPAPQEPPPAVQPNDPANFDFKVVPGIPPAADT